MLTDSERKIGFCRCLTSSKTNRVHVTIISHALQYVSSTLPHTHTYILCMYIFSNIICLQYLLIKYNTLFIPSWHQKLAHQNIYIYTKHTYGTYVSTHINDSNITRMHGCFIELCLMYVFFHTLSTSHCIVMIFKNIYLICLAYIQYNQHHPAIILKHNSFK